MENEDEQEPGNSIILVKQKIQYFFDNKIPIHLKLKKDTWKNGTIIELSSDFLMLEENLEGIQPIFFLEIEDVTAFKRSEK
jgi:hypothetical protein